MISSLDDYQELACKTAIYKDKDRVIYPAIGLSGEVGELNNKIKKWFIRDGDGNLTADQSESLKCELGGVFWYLAVMSRDLGFRLSEVATYNIKQLDDRAKRGKLGGDGDNR